MAVTAATATTDFSGFLPPEMTGPLFDRVLKASVVQQLVQKVPLGPNGITVPVITGRLAAGWVAEGALKPATSGSLALKTMTPHKIAAIAVVSAEVVRANPGGYMQMINPQIAEAFALAFDAAVLHGTNTPFASYLDQSTKALEIGGSTAAQGSAYADIVNALRLLVIDGKRLTGWALDSVLEPTLLQAVDTVGRPIFIDTPPIGTTDQSSPANAVTRRGSLIGRPSFMADSVATTNLTSVVGYGGDFTQLAWGQVGGVSFDVSSETALTINGTLTSLWEHNLIAVRAETEFGFLANDVQAFVKLSNATGS